MPRTKRTTTSTHKPPQAPTPAPTPTPPAQPEAAAPAEAPVPSPEPTVLPTPESLFDPAPPAPIPAEQPQGETAAPSEEAGDPAVADAEPEAETPPVVVEPAAPEAPAQPEAASGEQPSDEPRELRLGQAIGLLHRMPLGEVQTHLETFQGKIAALQFCAVVRDLQPRMRATEGRCAPIYFVGDDDGEPEFLFHGVEAVAAAQALGLETVSVVVIRPGDAGAVQSYLASQASVSAPSPEDDLVMAVTAYHEHG